MQTPLAQRLADYTTQVRFEDLPADVVQEVKRRFLDSIGCAMGAYHAEPCRIARQIASQISAEPGATIWGTDQRTAPDWAAFANGCLVRYLDYNDTYLSKEPAHPSDNIPAAFAAAQASGTNGRQLIAAVVAAYEIQCRLCDAASLRSIGWDHVTYCAFSTTAAAGKVLGLNSDQLCNAMGIAGVACAALRQTRVGQLSHWKGCAAANAARHGVFSAMLAANGMTGPSPIFEGENGFEKLVSGKFGIGGPFSENEKSRDSGLMILQASIKCWPVEYHAQSAVEASLSLRRELGNDFDPIKDIASVLIESHDAAVDIIGSEPEKWRPTRRETADHSLPYIVAAALVDGQITDRQFEPGRFMDPELLDLLSRVHVQRNAELSGMYPQAVGNIVTIDFRSGRSLSRRVDYPLGHAKNPMTDQLVEEKFHRMADPLLGRRRADQVAAWIWKLDAAQSLEELPRLLNVPESRI